MKLLLPVDGSETALAAVHHALRLIQSGLRAQVVLANVQEPATLYEVVVAHDAAVLESVSAAAAAHTLEAPSLLLRGAAVEFETEVCTGDPGHQLLDVIERYECDAVILGGRGVGGLHAGLGSVAESVLAGARVPVTVVMPAGR